MRPLKWYRRLQNGRIRRQEGFFLAEGIRVVEQIAKVNPAAVEEVLLVDSLDIPAFSTNFKVRILSREQYRSVFASVTPQGVAALLRLPSETSVPMLPDVPGTRIVLLDDVQDPGNVGTIIRTAAAFGFSGVLLTEGCADPFSPKAVQASAGALFMPWIRRHDTILAAVDTLRALQYRLACAVVGGDAHVEFSLHEKIIIALGNEGNGICEALLKRADIQYSIPMLHEAVESLNVAVAGSIALFSVFQGRGW